MNCSDDFTSQPKEPHGNSTARNRSVLRMLHYKPQRKSEYDFTVVVADKEATIDQFVNTKNWKKYKN